MFQRKGDVRSKFTWSDGVKRSQMKMALQERTENDLREEVRKETGR